MTERDKIVLTAKNQIIRANKLHNPEIFYNSIIEEALEKILVLNKKKVNEAFKNS